MEAFMRESPASAGSRADSNNWLLVVVSDYLIEQDQIEQQRRHRVKISRLYYRQQL
jgi:hypothetical protein